jgi:uncharacterized protein YcfL
VKRYLYPTIAFVLCCAVLSGCGPEIQVDNRSWGVRAVKELAKIENEILEVQVDVRNVSIMKVEFEYCFMWFDKSGFVLPGQRVERKSDVLTSGETKPLRATAPDMRAKKARLSIRQRETFGSIN